MASGLTLDSGALIAAEKGAPRFRAIWEEAVERAALVTVPADVISQVWRGNSPAVARILNACEIEVLDDQERRLAAPEPARGGGPARYCDRAGASAKRSRRGGAWRGREPPRQQTRSRGSSA
jgi:hypothetical protein